MVWDDPVGGMPKAIPGMEVPRPRQMADNAARLGVRRGRTNRQPTFGNAHAR
jgi:hypothetical protein